MSPKITTTPTISTPVFETAKKMPKKKNDSDSDEFEFMDAKSSKSYTPSVTTQSPSATQSDDSMTSPFPGLALNTTAVSEKEVSPTAKESRKPVIPTLTLPTKAMQATFDEFEAPPAARRRDEGSEIEPIVTTAPAITTTGSSKEIEPVPIAIEESEQHKPSKPTKPAKAVHTEVSTTAASTAVSDTPPPKPEKNLTAKERLALRREALKEQKASAAKTTPVKTPAPQKQSPGEVQPFEEYDDSFEN